jgi:hypothetical protein
MLLICGGIVGSLVGGYILDKTKAYKYVEIFVKKVSTFNSFFSILKIEKLRLLFMFFHFYLWYCLHQLYTFMNMWLLLQ